MFKRRGKSEDQPIDRRQVVRSGSSSPAFSYYSSNREPSRDRSQLKESTTTAEKGKRLALPGFAQLPLMLLVLVGIICLFKVLLLTTTPKVIVVGKSTAANAYLQPTGVYQAAAHKLLASSITSHTKLTIDLDGTAQKMKQKFPELQTVSVDVPLAGSRPIVYVELAQPSLILQTANGNYALNQSGVVLAKTPTIPSGIPLVVDQSSDAPKLGKQSLPSGTVNFVQTMQYQLKAAKINPSAYVLPASSPYELDIRIDGQAYYIKCNLQLDALTQSGAIIATLQQLANKLPTEYLDVRVPDRVYYK